MTEPASPLSPDQQKSLALEAVLQAWEAATQLGVDPEIIASTALFAAFTDMVDVHGEEAVALFCETLPKRIRAGEFTLKNGA